MAGPHPPDPEDGQREGAAQSGQASARGREGGGPRGDPAHRRAGRGVRKQVERWHRGRNPSRQRAIPNHQDLHGETNRSRDTDHASADDVVDRTRLHSAERHERGARRHDAMAKATRPRIWTAPGGIRRERPLQAASEGTAARRQGQHGATHDAWHLPWVQQGIQHVPRRERRGENDQGSRDHAPTDRRPLERGGPQEHHRHPVEFEGSVRGSEDRDGSRGRAPSESGE